MQAAEVPLYLNWSFWAVIVAFIAVILSQIPPIKNLIKKPKLDIEAYSKILISHKIGNPNLQLHLMLTNSGGRNVRIKDIYVHLTRDGGQLITLPAQNYLQNQNDQSSLLFTTFSLSSNQEWAHITNFLNFFDRVDGKKYQKIEGEMLADYREQAKLVDEKEGHLIEHPNELVSQAFNFFNSKFIWQSGEYTMKIEVKTVNDVANISKNYRFTIFETHTEQMKAITEQYKFGGGIWWEPKSVQAGVILQISEA
ncbi:hypothetical protein K8R14_05500 [bacterium]|nr:hypothetical protein [bacterium]